MIKKIYKLIQKKLFWSTDNSAERSINTKQVEKWFDTTQSIVFTEEYARKEENFLLPLIYNYNPTAVLDLGCGNGRYSRVLNDKVEQYTGVDISNNFINRLSATNNKKDFSFVHSPAHKFKSNDQFDLILMIGLITYMNDDEIREMNINCLQQLVKNGVLVVRNVDHGDKNRSIFDDKWNVLKLISRKPSYQIIRRPESEFLNLFSDFKLIEKHQIINTPNTVYFFKKK